ncbi:hypothetical protein ACM66B_002402 [Microbotryomycetes sp. NB124-2]
MIEAAAHRLGDKFSTNEGAKPSQVFLDTTGPANMQHDSDDKAASSQTELSSLRNDSAPQPKRFRRRGLSVLLASVVAVVVVLAVALGVGLGVKKRNIRSLNSPASSPEVPADSDKHNVTPQNSSSFILRGAQAMSLESPQERIFNFVLDQRYGSPDGFNRSMLVVNGLFPGPTIEVNEDDRIIVNVTNLMTNSTAIHWHGLYQRGTPYFDGTNGITQCGIPPGESLVYNFTLDGWTGTTWWHAHYATQYTDGLSGAIVVHARNKTSNATTVDPGSTTVDGEVVLELSDWYHRQSSDLVTQYLSTQGMTGEGLSGVSQGNEPVPDSGLINGVGQWGSGPFSYSSYNLDANKTYRLRLINSGSFAAIRFSVDNHTLTVVEADGTDVEPYEVSGVVLQVAQRYSVLLTTNQSPAAFWMRATVQQDAFTYTEEGFNGDQLGILRYGVASDSMPDATLVNSDPGSGPPNLSDMDTTKLVPFPSLEAPNSTVSYTVQISMQNTADNRWLSFINSTSWSPLRGQATLFQTSTTSFQAGAGTYDNESQLIVDVPQIEVVDLIVNNLDDGDHPFHLHGHKFWIVGQGAGRYQSQQQWTTTNPMRRDTVLIPAYSWMVLRFKADNPGVWAFHCHLVWHMAAGLLMQFSTLASSIPTPPSLMLDQCKSAANLVAE